MEDATVDVQASLLAKDTMNGEPTNEISFEDDDNVLPKTTRSGTYSYSTNPNSSNEGDIEEAININMSLNDSNPQQDASGPPSLATSESYHENEEDSSSPLMIPSSSAAIPPPESSLSLQHKEEYNEHEGLSPESGDSEAPSELRHFPPKNLQRKRKPVKPFEPKADPAYYGSISAENEAFRNNFVAQNSYNAEESDDSFHLLPPTPPKYEYDDASASSAERTTLSEQTPILSNNTYTKQQKTQDVFQSPQLVSFVQNGTMVSLTPPPPEVNNVLLLSPARRNLLPKSNSRPEPLNKIISRQKSIGIMVDQHVGQKQPTQCRDAIFAFVYITQVLIVICLGLRFGPIAFQSNGLSGEEESSSGSDWSHDVQFTYVNVLLIILTAGLVSMVLSVIILGLMAIFTKYLVHLALMQCLLLSLVWTVVGLIRSPHTFVPVTGLFAFGLSLAYIFTVWDKIPFVSANLFTALEATRSTFAILGLTGVVQILVLVWILVYFFTSIGIYDYYLDNPGTSTKLQILSFVGIAISFHWTISCMVYTIQVCVAGYVYRWWFNSRMSSSEKLDTVGESLARAMVYSFGSICFGSLSIGIANFLRWIADQIRPSPEDAPFPLLVVVQEAIVSCIDYVVAMFHDFAMVYVGMYGYGFLDAANASNKLFQKRGWQEIVEHHLLSYIFYMVSIMISGFAGCVCVEIVAANRLNLVSLGHPQMVSFCIGFFVGFIVSNILFSSIRSAVNAIVVCFAGRPLDFQRNHPECSHIMREAWRMSWPGLMDRVEKDDITYSSTRSPHRRYTRTNMDSLFT